MIGQNGEDVMGGIGSGCHAVAGGPQGAFVEGQPVTALSTLSTEEVIYRIAALTAAIFLLASMV